MNAIQFIKDHGVEKARKVVEGAPDRATTVKPSLDFKHFMYGICENAAGAYILLSDLKRLVESVDLVNCFDDLNQAKSWLGDMDGDLPYVFKGDTYDNKFYRHELKQAIADYESIYRGEHV
ncbi:hypothetical protein [Acinetobacter sp. 102]|uniref:hypothetical protein n=1 Tax=Acinetobacter sp. 102 TaxID=3098766 RepID=UPI003009BAF2